MVSISPAYIHYNSFCFSLVPDAEVMYVVSEVLAELPHPHHWQYSVLVNHVKLTEAILQHCSIPKDRYNDVAALLHKTAVYHCKNKCIFTIYGHLSCIIRHWIDFRMGGRGSVCLFHVVLTDYIIHILMRCIWEGM